MPFCRAACTACWDINISDAPLASSNAWQHVRGTYVPTKPLELDTTRNAAEAHCSVVQWCTMLADTEPHLATDTAHLQTTDATGVYATRMVCLNLMEVKKKAPTARQQHACEWCAC